MDATNTRPNMDQYENVKEVNILPLIMAVLKKLWLIILIAVIFAVGTYAATKFLIAPSYRSYFTAYVNNSQSQKSKDYLTSSDVIASKELVQTYSKILTSNTVLTAAADSLNSNLSYKKLSKMVSTSITDGTEIISVNVVTDSAELSFQLAKAIADTAPKYMAETVDGSSMKIIDQPVLETGIYSPNYVRFGVLGGLAGALLTVIIIIIRFLMDETIKDETELEDRFNIPVVGIVPDLSDLKDSDSDYSYSYSASANKKPTRTKEDKKR